MTIYNAKNIFYKNMIVLLSQKHIFIIKGIKKLNMNSQMNNQIL